MNKTKKASIKVTKRASSVSFSKIREDYDRIRPRQIRAFDLKELGYELDASQKVTGGNYELWMVLDADTKREVGFSFLVFKGSIAGACLPHSYSYYIDGGQAERTGGANESEQ